MLLCKYEFFAPVGPDVEKCRVRPVSLLSGSAKQCQLQCSRICQISGMYCLTPSSNDVYFVKIKENYCVQNSAGNL